MDRVHRGRTALTRTEPSKPIRLALAWDVIHPGASVFDYGCGRGDDLRELELLGIACSGWDPIHCPSVRPEHADIVNLGFVINVIENPEERVQTLRAAWQLARVALIVSARPRDEERKQSFVPHGDGLISSRGTFQKFYSQAELCTYIEDALEATPLAAAPGIFFVFRDDEARDDFVLRRYGRRSGLQRPSVSEEAYQELSQEMDSLVAFVRETGRIPQSREFAAAEVLATRFGSLRRAFVIARRALRLELPLPSTSRSRDRFEEHKDLLAELVTFIEDHGRLPQPAELECSPDLERSFGSVGQAGALVKRVYGREWAATCVHRVQQDLLAYLALARFTRRPPMKHLPLELQLDLRRHFGSYSAACASADELLFSAGRLDLIQNAAKISRIGHATDAGLYVCPSHVHQLPPILRVLVGCAERFLGDIEQATMLRISTVRSEVMYVCEEELPESVHTLIASTYRIHLTGPRVRCRIWDWRPRPPYAVRNVSVEAEDEPSDATPQRMTSEGPAPARISRTRPCGAAPEEATDPSRTAT